MENQNFKHTKALPRAAALLLMALCLLTGMPEATAAAVYAPAKAPVAATGPSDTDAAARTGKKMSTREKIVSRLVQKKLRKVLAAYPGLTQAHRWTQPDPDCATITLTNGESIAADIIAFERTSVRYRPCGQPASPEMSYELRDVASIQSANGELVYQSSQKEVYADTGSGPAQPLKTDPYALAALVFSALGVIVPVAFFTSATIIFGIIVFPLAVIFGFASLSRIRRYPDRYKGKGMAWVGIILGLAAILLVLLLIALVLILGFA